MNEASEPVTQVVETPVPGVTVECHTNAPAAEPSAEDAESDSVKPEPGSQVPAPFILGDYVPEFKDIFLPRLQIAQNIGDLKNAFYPGSVVFDQRFPIYTPGQINPKTGNVERQASPPAIITVLGFRPTRFCEKKEKFHAGERGLIVNSEAAVREAGGTLDYREWELKKAAGLKRFEPLVEALVAIERPEGCDDEDTIFVYQCEGKRYAIALWQMRGVVYTAAAKRVFFTQRAIGCLRNGFPTHSFAISTREETYPGGNKAWIPVCLPKAKNSPEFLAFAAGILKP